MRIQSLFSLTILTLAGALIIGCDSGEPRVATEGATPDAIAEYEAAVAAAEGNMGEYVESSPDGETPAE
jgi:hypothetical protein